MIRICDKLHTALIHSLHSQPFHTQFQQLTLYKIAITTNRSIVGFLHNTILCMLTVETALDFIFLIPRCNRLFYTVRK